MAENEQKDDKQVADAGSESKHTHVTAQAEEEVAPPAHDQSVQTEEVEVEAISDETLPKEPFSESSTSGTEASVAPVEEVVETPASEAPPAATQASPTTEETPTEPTAWKPRGRPAKPISRPPPPPPTRPR